MVESLSKGSTIIRESYDNIKFANVYRKSSCSILSKVYNNKCFHCLIVNCEKLVAQHLKEIISYRICKKSQSVHSDFSTLFQIQQNYCCTFVKIFEKDRTFQMQYLRYLVYYEEMYRAHFDFRLLPSFLFHQQWKKNENGDQGAPSMKCR